MIARALHKNRSGNARTRTAKKGKKSARPLAERIPRGATFRRQEVRCGKSGCWCTVGMGHGPYWYAFWKEGGRTRSAYIGGEDKLRDLLNDRHDLTDPGDEDTSAASPAAVRVRAGGGVRSRG